MSRYNRQANRLATGKHDSRGKHTTAGPQMEWKPIIKIVSDGGSCSQKDNEECSVNDVASEVKDLKLISKSLDDNCVSKNESQFGDKSQEDDDDHHHHVLPKKPFDICPKINYKVVKLKPPLHKINREKRTYKQLIEGQNIKILRPGMVLMKGYISCDDQVNIVKTCRDLGINDGGFYQPGYREGTKLHLRMMCLGKNWDPQSSKYSDIRSIDNAKPPVIPNKFHEMVKKALQDSNAYTEKMKPKTRFPSMVPDICIVNFYTDSGMLGLHQDKDESETSLKNGSPVVSFSIGGSAEFRYGEDRDIDKAEKVILDSGDVLIFGGKSRLIFHGVTSIDSVKAPTSLLEATDMRAGRLNLTFRQF